MCDLEAISDSSMFKLIRKVGAKTGQFPEESSKIEGMYLPKRIRNNRHKGDIVRGKIVIVCTV